MNTPTDQQLKLALAKELPELIAEDSEVENWFFWRDTKQTITDREWDWVVNQVLTNARNTIFSFTEYSVQLYISAGTQACTATWQQRAIAYFKTIGKEIV